MVPQKLSEVVQKVLHIVDIVIDAPEETPMTESQGELIETELTKILFASDRQGTLEFEHCGYDRGIYRTISKNETTRDWVKLIAPTLVFDLDKWPDAKLTTRDDGQPPKLVKASIFLKFPTREFGDICKAVDDRNPSICTKFWRIYGRDKVNKEKGTQMWHIGVDEDSASKIKTMDYHVQFGLNKLRISIHDNNNNKKRRY